MKQFLNVLFRWMNLTENGVIRWVFNRLIVKFKFNSFILFFSLLRHFRDPASSFWFEERRKYLPADDDRFWLVWSGILSAARTKGTVSRDGLGF
jgi:hypothetical protein